MGDMRPPYRLLSCPLLLVLACGDNGNSTTAASATETSSAGTTGTSTSPTTGTTTGSTTGTPTTTEGATSSTGTTTGGQGSNCAQYDNESECGLGGCDWIDVIGYTHGTQGCNGSLRKFCVPKETSGGLTSVWKDEGGDIEVVQFPFVPTDLPPEWEVCDCDGPLACLCTAQALDCPDRLEEFCSAITGENGCTNAAVNLEFVCGWFSVSEEGPLDTLCDDAPKVNTCLPATKIGEATCDPINLPYGQCAGFSTPVFWRDNAGLIEVIAVCGPEPVGWTKCVADDPGQPEECKCRC